MDPGAGPPKEKTPTKINRYDAEAGFQPIAEEQLQSKPIPLKFRILPHIPKWVEGFFLAGIILSFTIISIAAQSVFPERYSIFRNFISDLGGLQTDPRGHVVWNTGVIALGIVSAIIYVYFYQHLKPLRPKVARVATWIGVMSSLSFMGVGIFPEDYAVPHLFFAYLFFGGQYTAGRLYFVVSNQRRHAPTTAKWRVALLHVIFYPNDIALVGIFVMPTIRKAVFVNAASSSIPWIFSTTVWEWSLLFGTGIWVVGLFLLLPEDLQHRPLKVNVLPKDIAHYFKVSGGVQKVEESSAASPGP